MNKIDKIKTKSNYIKANSLLPEELLKEIQKYAQGQLIYIPKEKCDRKKWGSDSGGRKRITERNNEICKHFRSGISVEVLADKYFLSQETIKRIVYNKVNKNDKTDKINKIDKLDKIKEIRYV